MALKEEENKQLREALSANGFNSTKAATLKLKVKKESITKNI